MDETRESTVTALRKSYAPQTYEKIRHRWIAHSVAEDNRNIPGLIDTLTEDR